MLMMKCLLSMLMLVILMLMYIIVNLDIDFADTVDDLCIVSRAFKVFLSTYRHVVE